MGKRCRHKNALKTLTQGKENAENKQHPLLMSKEHCNPDPSPEPIRLMKQVKDCICEIYAEHKNDLEQRKMKRLDCKNPTDFFQPYNLVVNWPFQQRIRLQIQAVIKFHLGETLKESILSLMNDLIDYLYDFIKSFDGKKAYLQAIILYEAFHTLQNSISQIGNIISELISKHAFDIINKRNFYERIGSEYFILIEEIKKKESSQYVSDLNKMKLELENLNSNYDDERTIRFEYASTFYSDSCSELDESSSEAIHNLPIDELVEMLSKTKKQATKKKNKRKKKNKLNFNTNLQFLEMNKLDQEILEFTNTLEQHLVIENKFKPRVTEDFLFYLREKIKANRLSN